MILISVKVFIVYTCPKLKRYIPGSGCKDTIDYNHEEEKKKKFTL